MTAPVSLVEHAPATAHALPDAVGRAPAAARIVDAAPDPYVPGHWLLRAGSKVGAVSIDVPGGEPVTVNARCHHALHLARTVLDGASAEHTPSGLRIDWPRRARSPRAGASGLVPGDACAARTPERKSAGPGPRWRRSRATRSRALFLQ